MKYYRIIGGDPNKPVGFECEIPQSDPWSEDSMYMGRPLERIYDLPIKYQAINRKKLVDIPYCSREFLISKRLAEILRQSSAKYQIFESEIYRGNELIAKDYFSFIFTELFPAVNWEKSDCKNRNGYLGVNVRKLVLSKEKLSQIPESEHAFRLKESPRYLIIDKIVKDAIEKAGINTVFFQELETG